MGPCTFRPRELAYIFFDCKDIREDYDFVFRRYIFKKERGISSFKVQSTILNTNLQYSRD